jgi:5-methyltetrahydropteroyltriglutamate--homocysteine methyltransferase
MNKISIIGYPRIGKKRELKKITEDYLKGIINQKDFIEKSEKLMKDQLALLKNKGIDFIPSNDYSYYDSMLDTAVLLGIVPERYKNMRLTDLDIYFAMAKGWQTDKKDVKALEMKKWFNTNYHYIVPEIDKDTKIKLSGNKIFNNIRSAISLGIKTKPVLIGPFTFIKLCKIKSEKHIDYYLSDLIDTYTDIFKKLDDLKVEYLQLDEPFIVQNLTDDDKKLFSNIYLKLLIVKCSLKIILQTYFGDIRDIYNNVMSLDFDGIGLDFIEGQYNIELIKQKGFKNNTKLFAGIVNGKNIWKNDYKKSLDILNRISQFVNKDEIILNTSCSLVHVPYSLDSETKISAAYLEQMAFAEEKLAELNELKELFGDNNYLQNSKFVMNQMILSNRSKLSEMISHNLNNKSVNIDKNDYYRKTPFNKRIALQNETLKLPILPTTTIGSFPQTNEIRKLRNDYKKGLINEAQYRAGIKDKIDFIIKFQEKIGIDVLVHGEYERNDMVEYFGENLKGFIFTENGWVQSYGTRGVKPPIIFGDVERINPVSIDWIKYAQSKTSKPMKGMLTGPVTILNWSFVREDMSLKDIAYQIAFAIREEVKDLEAAGIKIIQIDEAALREKLPLRRENWNTDYLDWAIKAFRITCFDVKDDTQIHTHMCYSEFKDIIKEIIDMDADVITIESAKSDLSMLDVLMKNNYPNQIGPGVYDIHSSRIPSVEEFENTIKKMLDLFDVKKIWINPDCGLKTRGEKEVFESLRNMVQAVKNIRKSYI